MSNLIEEINSIPQLSIQETKNGIIVRNFFSSHLEDVNRLQYEILKKADRVSCFGDVENVGVSPQSMQLDSIGRPCVPQSSNRPIREEQFLSPIKCAFFNLPIC